MTTPLSPHTKASLLHSIEQLWNHTNALPTTTECWACKHFNLTLGFCDKWNDAVPKEAQDTGCDQWEFEPQSAPF